MRLTNFTRIAAVAVFGLAAMLGTTQTTNAQTNRQWEREQRRIERQERQRERQRERIRQYRIYNNGSYYTTDDRGVQVLRDAVNRGYQQGFYAGQNGRRNRSSYGYNGLSMYRSGNYGYNSYVNSSQYRYYFQQGFQRGYEDGYNSRYQYGYRSGSGINILGSILSGILNIAND